MAKRDCWNSAVSVTVAAVAVACAACAPGPKNPIAPVGVWWDGTQAGVTASGIPARVVRLCPDGRLVLNECVVAFTGDGRADIGEGAIWVGAWKAEDNHVVLDYRLQSLPPVVDGYPAIGTKARLDLAMTADALVGHGIRFTKLASPLEATLRSQLNCDYAGRH